MPILWSARNNVNYNETALLAALDDTARQSKTLLHNFYLKGLHSWQRGTSEAPFAFVIPDGQGDPARVAQLVALAHELSGVVCRDFLHDPRHDALAEIGAYRKAPEVTPHPFGCLPERLVEQSADSARTTRKMKVEEWSEQ